MYTGLYYVMYLEIQKKEEEGPELDYRVVFYPYFIL